LQSLKSLEVDAPLSYRDLSGIARSFPDHLNLLSFPWTAFSHPFPDALPTP
jgi:hypothetical protein